MGEYQSFSFILLGRSAASAKVDKLSQKACALNAARTVQCRQVKSSGSLLGITPAPLPGSPPLLHRQRVLGRAALVAAPPALLLLVVLFRPVAGALAVPLPHRPPDLLAHVVQRLLGVDRREALDGVRARAAEHARVAPAPAPARRRVRPRREEADVCEVPERLVAGQVAAVRGCAADARGRGAGAVALVRGRRLAAGDLEKVAPAAAAARGRVRVGVVVGLLAGLDDALGVKVGEHLRAELVDQVGDLGGELGAALAQLDEAVARGRVEGEDERSQGLGDVHAYLAES